MACIEGGTTAAPAAPAQATTSKTAAADTTSESGFIHLEAESGDNASTLSRPSYKQYARYEAFLTREEDFQAFGIMGDDESTLSRPSYEQYARYEAFLAREEDFQAFGIMGDDGDDCSSIDLEEFIMFEPQLVKTSDSYATVLKRGQRGQEDMQPRLQH